VGDQQEKTKVPENNHLKVENKKIDLNHPKVPVLFRRLDRSIFTF
jgi:hypothetical protein